MKRKISRCCLPMAACLTVIAVLASAPGMASELCATPVATESGQVRGQSEPDSSTCVWKGIPFAAPPVGDLRFRAPEPAAAWTGVRDAFEFGDRCPQVLTGKEAAATMSEDCLYLNIWRPDKSGVFPVMLWIHGGGYVMGSGGEGSKSGKAAYDGSELARFGDVVVVTINYRLHALGFFADPALRAEDPNGSVGNYGSLDQAAAIKWTHDNIANFGGDPGNVTIFGESAGGWSVCTMLATPLNRGMFQRAILESGGCEKSESVETGYDFGAKIARRVGCDPGDLDCLRAVPAKKFLGNLAILYQEGMAYSPHHDGWLLTGTPLAMIREGNYNQVPFLAGFNRNEVDVTLVFRPQLWRALPLQYEARLRRNLGLSKEDASRLAGLYPLSEFDNKPKRAYGKIFTDAGLACPTYLGLASAAARQPAAYLYRFDYDDSKYGKQIGALHALEVPFVFNDFAGGGGRGGGLYEEDRMEALRELARVMQSYWTNFAKTGDPNGPGLPAWPAFSPGEETLMVLDDEVRAESAEMKDRCAFWDEYYDRGLSGFEEALGRRAK